MSNFSYHSKTGRSNPLVGPISAYLNKEARDNRRIWTPKIVMNEIGSKTLLDLSFVVKDVSDPRTKMNSVSVKLIVGPETNPLWSVSHTINLDPREMGNDIVQKVKTATLECVERYRSWSIWYYLNVPDGCLIVNEDEHLQKKSAKAYDLLKGEGKVRDKLGVLLMEAEDGSVSVQLYQSPEQLKESFDQLSGKSGDKPMRATMLNLNYEGDVVGAATKMLPKPSVPPDEHPDMYVLGKGPVKFARGWEDEVKKEFEEFRQ